MVVRLTSTIGQLAAGVLAPAHRRTGRPTPEPSSESTSTAEVVLVQRLHRVVAYTLLAGTCRTPGES